jgi:acyl-CoA reductase-like NAD-dependent aldehyde dehydrogenase
LNPSTEEEICKVQRATKKDLDKAVIAARNAFEKGSWSKMTNSDRRDLLVKIGENIDK